MKYILEIYHQGDCIEHREQENILIPPAINEQIYIEFENPHYSEEHGNWWIVKKRRHLMFSIKCQIQTLMLDCEPDPQKGE
jgi:hypothetical protein